MGCTVLLLDDDDDLREALVALFALSGCVTFPVASLLEMQRLPPASLGADLAILDINLGAATPSGIDAYRWLRERRFPGRIVFLTGHAKDHPLVDEARKLDGVRVLEKPIPMDELLGLLAPSGGS